MRLLSLLFSVFCASLLHAFSQADKVLEPYNISPEVLDALLKNIKRRLTPQAIKIRADVEVMCFGYDGIDAIKDALKAAEALSTEEIPVKIKLVAPPLYVIMTQARYTRTQMTRNDQVLCCLSFLRCVPCKRKRALRVLNSRPCACCAASSSGSEQGEGNRDSPKGLRSHQFDGEIKAWW